MKKVLDVMDKILTAVIAVLLAAIIVLVLVQVVARNMKMSTPWTEEVAKYLLIWLTFLGAPVVFRRNEHLMVDLLYVRYSPKVRWITRLLFDLFIVAFMVYLTFFGYKLCIHPSTLKFVSPASGIPRVYIYAGLPIGSALMLVYVLYDIWNTIQIMRGNVEDTTVSQIVDESKSLAEIDAEMKAKGENA